jgi:hypothetical protein
VIAGAVPHAFDAKKVAGSWGDVVITAYMHLCSHDGNKSVSSDEVVGASQIAARLFSCSFVTHTSSPNHGFVRPICRA